MNPMQVNTYRTLRVRQLRAQIEALQHELALLLGEPVSPAREPATFSVVGERTTDPGAPKRPTLRKTNGNNPA